jgi:hypothetical protein
MGGETMRCTFKGPFTIVEHKDIRQAMRRLLAAQDDRARSSRWTAFKMVGVLETTYAVLQPSEGLVVRANAMDDLLCELKQHRHRLLRDRPLTTPRAAAHQCRVPVQMDR